MTGGNPEDGTLKSGSPTNGTRKGGAPRGNQNATRSGLKGSKLPRDARSEEIKLHDLRKLLRGLAEQSGRRGEETELAIQTAVRHEMTALLAIRWLRQEAIGDDGKRMPLETRLNLLQTLRQATEARDRVISRIVSGAARDDFASLYQREVNP